eukprot:766407-Hanusia_phi.AAC.10
MEQGTERQERREERGGTVAGDIDWGEEDILPQLRRGQQLHLRPAHQHVPARERIPRGVAGKEDRRCRDQQEVREHPPSAGGRAGVRHPILADPRREGFCEWMREEGGRGGGRGRGRQGEEGRKRKEGEGKRVR